ncbi:MAG: hypothetical protein LC800_04160 [Acidobacteria bacterium]|nr:hypothetical protein [Acidobacteriota bacterium]
MSRSANEKQFAASTAPGVTPTIGDAGQDAVDGLLRQPLDLVFLHGEGREVAYEVA